MSKSAETTIHKTPQRTCVACGRNDAKHDFVRFVRNKDGVVTCDESSRASGRGAYLCASESCFSTAQKRGRLGSTLKCQLTTEDYKRLESEFKDLCIKQEQRA